MAKVLEFFNVTMQSGYFHLLEEMGQGCIPEKYARSRAAKPVAVSVTEKVRGNDWRFACGEG